MVKVVDGGAWRAGVLVALFGLVAASNACGGRTVWLEEGAEGGDSGSGGVSGYGGDAGGYGGDYGGGGYTGGYGGTYGGSYGGGGYTGGYGGTYGGGGYTGGVAGNYGGTYGGGGYTGGIAGKGGYGGTAGVTGKGGTAGTAGVTGTGGCGAASGSGGSAGSPALSKSCAVFCTRYPYATCPSDFNGVQDCLGECQAGFGISSYCQYALVDFLGCTGQMLNPTAMCTNTGGGSCSGPGCLEDALLACTNSYLALLECEASPKPTPPCPPPPLPPNCGQAVSVGPDSCTRKTSCPGTNQSTDCYYQYDSAGTWTCDCILNGSYAGGLATSGSADPCASAAAVCGFY